MRPLAGRAAGSFASLFLVSQLATQGDTAVKEVQRPIGATGPSAQVAPVCHDPLFDQFQQVAVLHLLDAIG